MKHLCKVPSARPTIGRLSEVVFLSMFFGSILTVTSTMAATPEAPVTPEAVEIKNLGVDQSLIGQAGDAAEGRNLFASKKHGNCLACHVNDDLKEQLFHGEVGPSLNGVAGRWTEAQLRTIVINAKAVFSEETVMPGFYSLDVGENVRKDLIGKTILTAQQVEDVVAYLVTLK